MATMHPKRGEVWRADLDPARGSEQGKRRPVIVLSEPPTGRPTVRLCVPVMNAKPEHGALFWCVSLEPDANGLTKSSTADAAQARAIDFVRFEARLGKVTPDELELITSAVCLSIGRQPAPLPQPAPSPTKPTT